MFIHKYGVAMKTMRERELDELLIAIKSGNDADFAFSELARRYEPMMQSRVSSILPEECSRSEGMQEAHIALLNAAVTYDGKRCEGVTFGLYSSVCVCNALRSLARLRRRESEHTDRLKDEMKIIGGADVEGFVVTRDLCERVLKAAEETLTELEYEVFKLQLEGYSTREIAKRLSRGSKSIDNAKSRISKKLKRVDEIRHILSDV